MAGSGNAHENFRKAIGVLKDTTTVRMVKVNSEYKTLDVAIIKATTHDEYVPKEKYVQTVIQAVSASRPRADVGYCIHALSRRLARTRTWTVALKTLILVHRAMREADPSFCEELINYIQTRGHMLNLSHFNDDSTTKAWDYSTWIRTYSLYLEERLECFRVLRYDVQKERSRTKELDTIDLLDQLPALQKLLYRLLICQPFRVAHQYNYLIQYAISFIAAESVKIYVAIADGIVNLVDKFFEMQRHDAVKALDIYRKAGEQADQLSVFFEVCRGLHFGRGQSYVKIEQPPASFLTAMEQYIQEAPQIFMLPWEPNNDDGRNTPQIVAASETDSSSEIKQDNIDTEEKSEPSVTDQAEAAVTPPLMDLMCFDDIIPEPSDTEDNNPLALALVAPDDNAASANDSNLTSQSTSWELALVAATSSQEAAVQKTKVAGGLDRLTLDSLYANALIMPHLSGTYPVGGVSSNPFETDSYAQDPYYASNMASPATFTEQQHEALFMQQQQQLHYANAQMANLGQQQEALMMQHQQQLPQTNARMANFPQQQEAWIMQQQHLQQPNSQMANFGLQQESLAMQQQQQHLQSPNSQMANIGMQQDPLVMQQQPLLQKNAQMAQMASQQEPFISQEHQQQQQQQPQDANAQTDIGQQPAAFSMPQQQQQQPLQQHPHDPANSGNPFLEHDSPSHASQGHSSFSSLI